MRAQPGGTGLQTFRTSWILHKSARKPAAGSAHILHPGIGRRHCARTFAVPECRFSFCLPRGLRGADIVIAHTSQEEVPYE